MFNKILIANRGEIACRIIRTAQKMGIRTAIIYHPIEANALCVKQADEAIAIETPSPRAAYLDSDKIMQAAKKVNAEAIHPGYGFLAENKAFAEACKKAKLVFIGPSPHALEVMGQKDKAKILMQAAGVPIIPGYFGEDQTVETLCNSAVKIGFPLLIKAIAGGGGKAMRNVLSMEELKTVLPAVMREAQQSFADSHVMLEKYLPRARHIEVQIFGDSFKNYVHLFERDCSLQRRYQKILEEAPATHLPDKVRTGLYTAALQAARAVDYEGAGTVEFLVDDQDYYFLEMNTRLQVEHPVTEFITGIDLVEWQFRVAAGERLPLKQSEIIEKNHAIEVRICAEDPAHDFLPAMGTVELLQYPSQTLSVRVENGIQQGDTITPYFDSLLAKLIVSGETRERALQNLYTALTETKILGVQTNLSFLQQLTQKLLHDPQPLFTSSVLETMPSADPTLSPWQQQNGWRLNAPAVAIQEGLMQQQTADVKHTPGLQAPMPGIIVQIFVQEGQHVVAGDRLLAIEAMKMEHTIRAPAKGIVQKIYFKVGDMVNRGVDLVELSDE